MQTDTILYELFRLYPNLLLELVGESPAPNSYHFEAPEVKQATFRFDGMLIPTGPDQPLYFIECQFYKDKYFYFKYFAKIMVYFKQKHYDGDWRAVVLFARPSLDPGVPIPYQDFQENGRLYRLYLKPNQDRPGSLRLNVLQLLAVPKNQLKRRVQQVVNRVQAEVDQALEQAQILDLVTTLLVYKFPNQERRALEMAFGLKELSKTRVYQEAKAEGREEGIQEGRAEGALRAAPALLERGFSVEQTAQILGLSIEQVQSVIP